MVEESLELSLTLSILDRKTPSFPEKSGMVRKWPVSLQSRGLLPLQPESSAETNTKRASVTTRLRVLLLEALSAPLDKRWGFKIFFIVV